VAVNILVADDSVTMRRILELTFQGEDARVTAVESGESAVRKASELTPDVVFADLSMSGGMDGYAIASAIKAAPGLERTAVVVMASQKHPYDDEKGKAAGVDDHILKPFDTQHVIDRLKQVLNRPRVAPAGAARAAAPAAPATAAAASRIGTKTIAFGKPPAAANAANAGNVPAAPVAAPPRPQVAAGAPAYATASAASPATKGAVATAHHAAAPVVHAPPVAAPVVAPAAAPPVAAAVAAASGNLEHKLSGLGLTAEQIEAVARLSREVVERVVWEVVPDMAEALIKEEIRRLTAG
jgi:CheY-like chemotaxis protein